ncbi:MAG: phage/plasmid primase, P4 family [Oscillospiraceae bacterium]
MYKTHEDPNESKNTINTGGEKLIDPMIFFRPLKMPPPPDGTIDPMEFFEEIPPDEVPPTKDGLARILPSFINTLAFPDIDPEASVGGSPPVTPAEHEASLDILRAPPLPLQDKPPGPNPKPGLKPVWSGGQKPTPYETMSEVLQLLTLCVVDCNLYIYQGARYQLLSPEEAQRLIVSHCRDAVECVGTPGHLRAVYDLLLLEPRILRTVEDVSQSIVSFQNGVLSLATRQLHPHSPAFFTTYSLCCSYRSDALDCPVFSAFLAQVTGGDSLLAQRIWEMIGYCLVPDLGGKVIFPLQGVPNSGKSLLSSLIENFFPLDAVAALDVHVLGDKFAASELVGKALCISPDLPSGPLDTKSTSVLKQLSGNDLVSADVKYQRRAKFRCTAKFILASNHPLITKHQDDALTDRLVVIPFRFSVPKEQRDPHLMDCFKLELDAIAYYGIQAYFRLVNRHYKFSGDFPLNEVVTTGLGCNTEMDPASCIFAFVRTSFRCDPAKGIFTADAHKLFQQSYFEIPLNLFSHLFAQAAQQLYGTIKRRIRRDGTSNPTSYIEGITLVEER